MSSFVRAAAILREEAAPFERGRPTAAASTCVLAATPSLRRPSGPGGKGRLSFSVQPSLFSSWADLPRTKNSKAAKLGST